MAKNFNLMPQREALANIGKEFHHRNWMAGTAGNLSARIIDAPNSFWITSSGLPKGGLVANDMIQVNIDDGNMLHRFQDTAKPSAETSIHQTIYKLFPDAQACFHVHSVDASLATDSISPSALDMPLPPLEMIKGLDIWEQDPQVDLPVFDNILDVQTIAREIVKRFSQSPPKVPALMIRNHGITVWGDSLQQTYNRVEIVEFIMSYLARKA
ncbi:methylthioribulose 1-phosphate dehydratase [Pseudomonadota bacterium]